MRLFLLLAAALVAGLNAAPASPKNYPATVTEYTMPGGIPDGTILTFYFWHIANGDHDHKEPVAINFYDLPKISIHEVYDITAHLRIDRAYNKPVESNSFINGAWKTGTVHEMPMDDKPERNGWWRVDVYKHDEYTFNVFFQGFWAGVHTFHKSLDSIRSIYVISSFVDHNYVQIRVKYPNSNVPPMSLAQAYTFLNDDAKPNRVLLSFPSFPIGTHMEMTAVLRASGGMKGGTPSLWFQSKDPTWVWFMSIQQNWIKTSLAGVYTEELWITHSYYPRWGTKCSNDIAHGDLQHFRVERIALNKISLQNFYDHKSGEKGVYCEHTVEEEYVRYLDQPFDITSHQGAMILHLDHSIPRRVEVKND